MGQSEGYKIGDYVKIQKSMALHNRYCFGTIVHINGAYINVKLNYKGIIVERYPCELSKVSKGR